MSVVNLRFGNRDWFSINFSTLGRNNELWLIWVWMMWVVTPRLCTLWVVSLTATKQGQPESESKQKTPVGNARSSTKELWAPLPLGQEILWDVLPMLQSQRGSSQANSCSLHKPYTRPPCWFSQLQMQIYVSYFIYMFWPRKLWSYLCLSPFSNTLNPSFHQGQLIPDLKQILHLPKLVLISFLWTNYFHQILTLLLSFIDFGVFHEFFHIISYLYISLHTS